MKTIRNKQTGHIIRVRDEVAGRIVECEPGWTYSTRGVWRRAEVIGGTTTAEQKDGDT